MSRNSMIQECNRENRKLRKVIESKGMARSSFWSQTTGSFLITGDGGGMAAERREMLLSAMLHKDSLQDGFVLLLYEDELLEQKLIEQVRNGSWKRRLVVISEEYRNYHFFYGMDVEEVVHCIGKIGNYLKFQDIAGIVSYAEAFLKILEKMYPISLPAMLSMAELSDEDIEELGKRQGIGEFWISRLKKGSDSCSEGFRRILKQVSYAAQSITTLDCESGFNLLTAAKQNQVVCIHMKSRDSGILNICLAAELEQLYGEHINVVIDNISLHKEDELGDILEEINKRERNCLGICGTDVYKLWGNTEPEGFETQVIFPHSNREQTEKYLKKFGTYRHSQVTESQGKNDKRNGIFSFVSQRSWQIEHYERMRVMPEEIRFALVKGHRQDMLELIDGWLN